MITDGKIFDTNVFFSGGAGMFIQYHDIIKPVWLFVIIKMILTGETYGLPVDIIKNMSVISIIEWYIKRRYVNPLRCLDYANNIDVEDMDKLLHQLLMDDSSIYKLSPEFNISKMMNVYRQQQMKFPIYIYSEHEEPYIKEDCKEIFHGINYTYLFGDLKDAISKCDRNFTYIFSDIEMVKKVSEILTGTCSHVLIANEYRYNYIDNCRRFKYDLNSLAEQHPFTRIGITNAIDMEQLILSFERLKMTGGT